MPPEMIMCASQRKLVGAGGLVLAPGYATGSGPARATSSTDGS